MPRIACPLLFSWVLCASVLFHPYNFTSHSFNWLSGRVEVDELPSITKSHKITLFWAQRFNFSSCVCVFFLFWFHKVAKCTWKLEWPFILFKTTCGKKIEQIWIHWRRVCECAKKERASRNKEWKKKKGQINIGRASARTGGEKNTGFKPTTSFYVPKHYNTIYIWLFGEIFRRST